MANRKVVITGLGAIAPNGNTVNEYWDALLAGKSGVDTIRSYDTTDHSVKIAGEVTDFNPEDFMERREVRKLDRFSILALVAAAEAEKTAAAMDAEKPRPLPGFPGTGELASG